jgi:hypothetical protein
MKHEMNSRSPELDESEIKALIEDFDMIGMLLKEHLTIFSSPILMPKSKKCVTRALFLLRSSLKNV